MKNIQFDPAKGEAVVFVNPKIFALEIIYSAAYTLLDRAYFILDGNPTKKIEVTVIPIKKTGKKELEKLALEFQNELINYSVYVVQAARNQSVREAIIKRALLTNLGKEKTEEFIEGYSEELIKKAKEVRMDDTIVNDEIGLKVEKPDEAIQTGEEAKEQGAGAQGHEDNDDLYLKDPEGIAELWTPEKAAGLTFPAKKKEKSEPQGVTSKEKKSEPDEDKGK